MKKAIVLITILLYSINSISQSPVGIVTDPKNTAVNKENAILNKANLAKSGKILAEAKKNLNETKKSVKLLKSAKDAVEKVSNVLRDIDNIDMIIETQKKIIKNTKESMNKLKNANIYSSSEIVTIYGNFTRVISSSNKIVDLANDLLTDGVFKMNDAERLKFLKDAQIELTSALIDIKSLNRKYTRIMRSRLIAKYRKEKMKK